MKMAGFDFKDAVWAFLSILAALTAGIGVRARLSKDGVDRSKNKAEQSIYDKQLTETKLDLDQTRKALDDTWKIVRKREVEISRLHSRNYMLSAQLNLIHKLVKKYPDLSQFLPSDPVPLESSPLTDPNTSQPGDN